MLRLSFSTFAQRWPLFAGAILTVCLGVGLVQSSLLILISAATGGYVEAITLLAITLAVSVFLAVFIVSSTFAFTVAQRRKDLALLRLVGGSRKQLRRLLLSEALLLGLIGTAIGVPIGVALMDVQTWLLGTLGFVPGGFDPAWLDWILGVSAGIGVGVAVAGVLAASKRAAAVRPLEALRDTGSAAKVMTGTRWFFGLLFLAGTVALVIVASFAGPVAAIPLTVNSALTAAVALSALSPLVVPLLGRLLGLALRGSALGRLAQANLTDGVRRSASTAAPLLVLVALLLGQSGVMASIGEATEREQRRNLVGDLVVTGQGAPGAGLAETPGVASVATRFDVPITVTTRTVDDGEVETETEDDAALAIDPETYALANPAMASDGALAELSGDTVVVGDDSGFAAGDTITVAIKGVESGERTMRVAGVLPPALDSPYVVIAAESVPADVAATLPSYSIVKLAEGTSPEAVASAIEQRGLGQVSPLGDWIGAQAVKQQDVSTGIMTVILGLSGLYALIAVVNAVVIAAAERKREFAIARLSGLSRPQVVRTALVESLAVTVIGLVLGGVAAAGTWAGIGMATHRILGEAVVVVPWALLGIVVAGAFAVVTVTSVLTSLSATRPRPISLAGAGE
ncbi:FtsX-like permease family protein [Saccharomonospora sp. NPDC006951]